MNIESPKIKIGKSSEYLFTSLTEIKNFEKLMPENTSFQVIDENCFAFALKGLPEIKLVKKESTPHSEIILGAASSKLPFELKALLNKVDEENTEVQLFFTGEFNPMMAMMIKGPISKFMESLVNNMNKL